MKLRAWIGIVLILLSIVGMCFWESRGREIFLDSTPGTQVGCDTWEM